MGREGEGGEFECGCGGYTGIRNFCKLRRTFYSCISLVCVVTEAHEGVFKPCRELTHQDEGVFSEPICRIDFSGHPFDEVLPNILPNSTNVDYGMLFG